MKSNKPKGEQINMSIRHCTRRDFLNAVGLGTVTLAMQGCVSASGRISDKTSARRPNIIFILADDLGWAELGCYGLSLIHI